MTGRTDVRDEGGRILGDGDVRRCRVCGCNDDRGCRTLDGGTCHWVEWDLCSYCTQEGAL